MAFKFEFRTALASSGLATNWTVPRGSERFEWQKGRWQRREVFAACKRPCAGALLKINAKIVGKHSYRFETFEKSRFPLD